MQPVDSVSRLDVRTRRRYIEAVKTLCESINILINKTLSSERENENRINLVFRLRLTESVVCAKSTGELSKIIFDFDPNN